MCLQKVAHLRLPPLICCWPLQTGIASLQGRPGERKQDAHLTCNFLARHLTERGHGWPRARGNRILQPGMSARLKGNTEPHLSSFAAHSCLLGCDGGKVGSLNPIATRTPAQKIRFEFKTVKMIQGSRMIRTHGTAYASGVCRVCIIASVRTRIFCGKTVLR